MRLRAAALDAERQAGLPWYRHGWVWFVIAIPLVAVLGGIATAIVALRTGDGVVAADYYKRGLAINEALSRRERARALGLEAELTADGIDGGDRVRLSVRAAGALPPEPTVTVRLVHPARAGADRTALLARTAAASDGRSAEFAGSWADATSATANVAWELIVETPSWRIEGGAGALTAAARNVRLRAH
ncbi:MAG TPA: FixH family protein [Burkholderiaceae bacterium]|jgi:hypothetical protein|nr:FixH family protein [Burkholderiaceae bacterium]